MDRDLKSWTLSQDHYYQTWSAPLNSQQSSFETINHRMLPISCKKKYKNLFSAKRETSISLNRVTISLHNQWSIEFLFKDIWQSCSLKREGWVWASSAVLKAVFWCIMVEAEQIYRLEWNHLPLLQLGFVSDMKWRSSALKLDPIKQTLTLQSPNTNKATVLKWVLFWLFVSWRRWSVNRK